MPTWLSYPEIPAGLVVFLALMSALIARSSKFRTPPKRYWPYAQRPGLALELADSREFVDAILGDSQGEIGKTNRRSAILIQRLDVPLIFGYVSLFAAVAWQISGSALALVPAVLAVLTGLFDFAEDIRIIGLVSGRSSAPAKPFGQTKWLCYFLTLAAEGAMFFLATGAGGGRKAGGWLLAVLLIANGIGGVISARKGSFNGILSGAALSALLLVFLGLSPLFAAATFRWHMVAEYAVLMRVPLLAAMTLVALPAIAFFTSARSLLRGLFDVTPLGHIAVVLSSVAVSGAIAMTGYVVLRNAHARANAPAIDTGWAEGKWIWLLVTAAISAPVILSAVTFSIRQGRGVWKCMTSSALTAMGSLIIVFLVAHLNASGILRPVFTNGIAADLKNRGLLAGYVSATGDPIPDHSKALAAFAISFFAYVIVGVYGYFRIGRRRTVPALSSALMLMMLLVWTLAAVAFFFDAWHIPIFLILVLAAIITAQSANSDHFYHLIQPSAGRNAPLPRDVLAHGGKRVIVAAANGGGIQAGAWAAQVLYGLHSDIPKFGPALRLISSVSGGSVGTAYYTHWRANPQQASLPTCSASLSSLDEVAWGLAWPDFLRALLPWFFRKFIGRGRALEEAWRRNAADGKAGQLEMDKPLSDWNDRVAHGDLPAVIMNATVAETGERLLFATSRMSRRNSLGRARVNSSALHTVNGKHFDVGVATAARMSASFPYVTPAARSDGEGPQPHVVDGGYYDNYGMATLVEWLDEGLTDCQNVESVLVIQIHGVPDDGDLTEERYAKTRGWFYQAIAPISTLISVRTAGQVAHNDIELKFLQDKWAGRVRIESAKFVFPNAQAPLSWHLTPEEQKCIREVWAEDPEIADAKRAVAEFLG